MTDEETSSLLRLIQNYWHGARSVETAEDVLRLLQEKLQEALLD